VPAHRGIADVGEQPDRADHHQWAKFALVDLVRDRRYTFDNDVCQARKGQTEMTGFYIASAVLVVFGLVAMVMGARQS
jgi:hypothetical protein